jgi:hypothetical protein
MDTANVGSRAPASPFLLWRCARGGPLPYTAGAPDQGADRIGFSIWRSEDHIPNTRLIGASSLSTVAKACWVRM